MASDFPRNRNPPGLRAYWKADRIRSLQARPSVDQDVAATDQIELRKRRVVRQVVPRKNAQAAYFFVDLIAVLDFEEEASQARGRYAAQGSVRIDSRSGHARRPVR